MEACLVSKTATSLREAGLQSTGGNHFSNSEVPKPDQNPLNSDFILQRQKKKKFKCVLLENLNTNVSM